MKIQQISAIILSVGIAATSAVAEYANVQVLAAADTDYGSNTVATMVSEVLTAPDGVATYQIAYDVTPPAGRSIRSGITGTAGTSTNWSWGIGPEDTIFKGSDDDRVELIGNLQITNFNANGGVWTLNNFSALSFTAIEIANGQTGGNDAVQVVVNGGVTNDLGSLSTNPDSIDLEALAVEGVAVTNFALGTSTTNAANKWSVNHVEVMVVFGGRADWLRGSWGINWKPTRRQNGKSETLVIDDFLDQISGLKTLDYIQTHLSESSIYSPVHFGTHELLESFWQGDTDTSGAIINLVVPRAEIGFDPFRKKLEAVKAAGLKNQVYVNSSNMLSRDGPGGSNPAVIPNITERWKAWCDTNTTAQAFIASQPYHTDGVNPGRPYMFCYAEFVLKDYAIRYGDLIDGWLFDSGRWMWQHNGDDRASDDVNDQRIYQAFAEACHAGNPIAAVSFQNSPGSGDGINNPFTPATLYCDYMFGHPFQGGKQIGSHEVPANGALPRYDRNYSIVEWIVAKAGNVHYDDGPWTWDDKVVGHFDPPMSTSSWNGGGTPALTDEEFLLWNREALIGGGAMSWGASLNADEGLDPEDVLIRDWAMAQLTLLDDHLSVTQYPGIANWARAETPLPDATIGQPYLHSLTDGFDFWDPAGGSITDLLLTNHPSWLMITNSGPGEWTLNGAPTETEATDYSFELRAMIGTTGTSRTVELTVDELTAVEPGPVQTNITILAVATNDYGTDAVATMMSPVQSYGGATFQIALDVVPKPGTSVRSGHGGGQTTINSWGIFSPGETNKHTMIFKGDEDESVEGIANLRVTNFNANGSSLTSTNITGLSFQSVVIADSQSTHDRVVVVANGVTNNPGGTKQATNPFDYDLEVLAGSTSVSNFSLATGSSASDQTKNKWAVNSIVVNYTANPPAEESFSTWASGYGLTGNDALPGADVENSGIGDGYDNLAEFALGMNPTNSDAGSMESVGTAIEGGTNWFEYVHGRRADYVAQGLSYLLIDSTNLVGSVVSTNAQDQILVGPAVDGYEPVTNRYKADGPAKFIQLKIQQN